MSNREHEASSDPEYVVALDEALRHRRAGTLEHDTFCARYPEHGPRVFAELGVLDRLEYSPGEGPGVVAIHGRRIGHYRLLCPIGRGGQGRVYLAEDTRLQRRVALKLVPRTPVGSAAQLRFAREATAASRLQHPGVCTVYEVGDDEDVAFIAMEYIEGESLDKKIASARRASKSDPGIRSVPLEASDDHTADSSGRHRLTWVVRLVSTAARALHAAHDAGLIHRDVKPGNFMVNPKGLPVLVDFGLARLQEGGDALTRAGELMGTPAYMSPEQLASEHVPVDHRSDIYSLGVVLYECLTLTHPFDVPTREAMHQAILTRDPPDPRRHNPAVGRDLAAVLDTAMQKTPDRRYQTAAAFADDLDRVAAGRPVSVKPVSLAGRGGRWARRNPATAGAAGLAAALLLVIVALLIGRGIAGRSAARVASDDARREAKETIARIEREWAQLVQLQRGASEQRQACFGGFALEAARARLCAVEGDIVKRQDRLGQRLGDVQEALDRADRQDLLHGDADRRRESDVLRAAFALTRYRHALARDDRVAAARHARAVRRYDHDERHEAVLREAGTLTIDVHPTDANIFLFRYVQYDEVRKDRPVVSRLVPAPSNGVGFDGDPWGRETGVGPGDPCLEVTAVEAGSLADEAGLRPGDLVLTVNEKPCGRGLFVVAPGDVAGVKPLDRIERFEDEPVDCRFDFEYGFRPRPGEPPRPRGRETRAWIGGRPVPMRGPGALTFATPEGLVEAPAPAAITLSCLRDDAPITLRVARGARSGLSCERTAYPLIRGARNRVPAAAPIEIDADSYLLLVRREGFECQRFPVLIPRGEAVRVNVSLLTCGSTPPGFVYVPPGAFHYGGDENAVLSSWLEQRPEVPGYFIARHELTNRAWFAFMNDEETRRQLARKKGPIDMVRAKPPLVTRRSNGDYWASYGSPDAPVVGPSIRDVRAYLQWRTDRAKADGSPFSYDLPSEVQWEKAARGVDGRLFPWGDRFDFSLTVSMHYRPRKWLGVEAGGVEPRDESPYGVRDLAGSRSEWTRDRFSDGNPNYVFRGASWTGPYPNHFRVATRRASPPFQGAEYRGFRLIARRANAPAKKSRGAAATRPR